MQNSAALAYQQVGKKTVNPRDLEANLLSRSAAHMQRIRDDWDGLEHELSAALAFNKRLWNVFLSSVTSEQSQLPRNLRENVANLGIFVMKHTLATEARPNAAKLDVLISINRELAAGLRASTAAAGQ